MVDAATYEAHCEEMRGSITILAAALEAGDVARVLDALRHGGSELLDWRDELGASLLHLAAGGPRENWAIEPLVQDLLVRGAHVGACDNMGLMPLHAAARAGSAAVIAALVAAGADVHASGGALGTMRPLDLAVGEEARAALLLAGASMPGSRSGSRSASRSASRGTTPSPAGGSLGSRRPSLDAMSDAVASRLHISDPGGDPVAVPISDPGGSATRTPSASRHAQRLRALVHDSPPPAAAPSAAG